MKQKKTTAIALMLRAPQIGKIKRRLAQTLGEKDTHYLYTQMVEDITETLQHTKADIIYSVEPADQLHTIKTWLPKPTALQGQHKGALGEKMHQLTIDLITKGYNNIILIGSDIPSLSTAILNQAIEMLEDNCVDTLIGPAGDGGYYLIGFKQNSYNKQMFEHIDWGSDNVYLQTMQTLDRLGNQTGILPTLRDIDTIDDLTGLKEEFLQHKSGNRTQKALEKLKIF